MKKLQILVLLFSIFIVLDSYSQRIEVLDFESTNDNIEIDTSNKSNIWQIGHPSKQFFDSAYSGVNAIVTDTFNPYPVNCNSKFILKIDSSHLNFPNVSIAFWHKFDTDSLKDFGIIYYSFDDTLNWKYLRDTTYNEQNHVLYNEPIHGFWWRSLPNLTGESLGWIYSEYVWLWFAPAKSTNIKTTTILKSTSSEWPFIPKKIYIKFQFISDSIKDNKSGWMIDNIRIHDYVWSNTTNINTDYKIIIYPNPTDEKLNIRLPDNLAIEKYIVYDIKGNELLEKKITNKFFELDVSNFNRGQYLVSFFNENVLISTRRFILH